MSDDFEAKANRKLNKIYKWRPANIIDVPYKVDNGHACVVLNRKLRIPEHVVTELWQNASTRCCVDGGANHWRQFLIQNKHLEYILKPPDMISGDFDSLTDETREYFNSRETQFIYTPDQSATDFTKALTTIKPSLEMNHIKNIIVFHDNCGRFDQIMANVNTLYKFEQDDINIYLLSCNSLTWLVKPGKHSITIPSDLVQDQRWCALIPVGREAADVTTKGLKWDLTNHCLKFGGMVSTSNTYSLGVVEIETNAPLLWSMGIFDPSDDY